MELQSISSWLLPAAGAATAVGVAAVAGLKAYKKYNLIEVNCHFCDKNSVTFRHFRESWYCPHCSQYNGFTADGDYNMEVPGQKCVDNEPEKKAAFSQQSAQPALCAQCNFNQTLKIEALRNFVAYDEDNYEAELQEYKVALERTYKLCRRCENRVHQILGAQDSAFRRNLVQVWKQRSANATMTSTPVKRNVSASQPKLTQVPRNYAKIIVSSMVLLLTMFPSYKPSTKDFLARNDLVFAGIDFLPSSTSCVDWLEVFYSVACLGAVWTTKAPHLVVKVIQLALCAAMVFFPSSIMAWMLFLSTVVELLPFQRLKEALKKTKFGQQKEVVVQKATNGTFQKFEQQLKTQVAEKLNKLPNGVPNGVQPSMVVQNNNDLDEVEDMDVSFDSKVEKTVNILDELHIGDGYRSFMDRTSRTQIVLDSDRDFPSPIGRASSVVLRPSRFGMTPFGGTRTFNHGHFLHSASFSQPGSPAPSIFGDDRFDTGSIYSEPCRPTEFRPPSPPNYNSTFIEERSSYLNSSHSPAFTRRSVASDVVSTASQTETVIIRHEESAMSRVLLLGAMLCLFFTVFLACFMHRHEEIGWAFNALRGRH